MDLSAFYGKVRAQEREITEEFPLIVSHETGSGGRAGQVAEVARTVAARFIVQGLARLAMHDESKLFRDAQAKAKQEADALLEAAKSSVTMLTAIGIQQLQERLKAQEPNKE